MKRLWIACAILALLLAATLWNAGRLERFTASLTDLLEQAEAQAEGEAWREAYALTRLAYDRWESRSTSLHITLRHSDTDDIQTGFQEVLEFLQCQEAGEYSAAHVRLIAPLELLSEAEQLSLVTIL